MSERNEFDENELPPVPPISLPTDLAEAVPNTPTFTYSAMCNEGIALPSPTRGSDAGRGSFSGSRSPVRLSNSGPRSSGLTAGDVFVRGSLLDRDITAVATDPHIKPERTKDYRGRRRVWPGIMAIVLLLGAIGFSIAFFAVKERSDRNVRAAEYEQNLANATRIQGGQVHTGDDLVEDDGAIGNPKKYAGSVCELPNYLSKNGHIVAVSADGSEVPIRIKGINWFGMETGQAIPFGLWDNDKNGTTAYQVASFLHDNKFNAVRLPLMAAHILDNTPPATYMINAYENRALGLKNYMSMLQSIIKVLQYRRIGVLISMHTLTVHDGGNLWYNSDIPEEKFLKAIDILTENLCSKEYWNVIGIDVKNEPWKGVWGGGGATDFRAGAIRIANRMLKGCPSWLGFVEGVNAQHSLTIDGQKFGYYDWFGGGLHGAKQSPIDFAVPNKVVYAPHYYTPAVFPQYYLYGGGTVGDGNVIKGYVELDDDKLRHRIQVSMDDMFGFLYDTKGPALLLGEFGGLYAEDKHPKKTTQRCTDFTIEIIKKWGGGFVWSLNPESAYQYNPADTAGNFVEGMVQTDWLQANTKFLEGMAAMDDMENLRSFPCFSKTSSGATATAAKTTAPTAASTNNATGNSTDAKKP